MRIACIAWGSLLWKAEQVRTSAPWMPDGPLLSLELARPGEEGELAIVLCEGAPLQPTRWTYLEATDLAVAREQLRAREGVSSERRAWIGSVPAADGCVENEAIARWVSSRPLDAVIWTAVPPKARGVEGKMPTADEALDYLRGLTGQRRAHAEDYVRRIPADIMTPYRALIAEQLGWTALVG